MSEPLGAEFAVPTCPCATSKPKRRSLPEHTIRRCSNCGQLWELVNFPSVWGSASGWVKVGRNVAAEQASTAFGSP